MAVFALGKHNDVTGFGIFFFGILGPGPSGRCWEVQGEHWVRGGTRGFVDPRWRNPFWLVFFLDWKTRFIEF